MLILVKTPIQKLEKYKGIISNSLYREINNLAKNLKGLRVVHINSTPRGGGVAEVLKSLVPLMKGIAIKAEWYVIPPGRKFFGLTKEIHNALQGKEVFLSSDFQKSYQRYTKRFAKLMLDMKADVWIFHDPQPVGIIQFLPNSGFHPIISRIHIDTSIPNLEAWNFIKKFLVEYDKIIFSTKKFVYKDIAKEKVVIFPPAIDPLVEKNMPISLSSAKEILEGFGIDSKKPLISQISRFDLWKDPIGVIKAYRLAKKEIPDLQLALVGLFLAHDDPGAMRVFDIVKKEAKGDKDIFLFSNPDQLGSLKVDRFVNAFQQGSDVVLQKSIKEGFGLCVLPNTEVLTERGPIRIKDITKGEKVLTEDGTFHRIKNKTNRQVDKYLELTAWKGMKVGVTEEHPFLSTSRSRKSRPRIAENDLHWVKADELSKGDFIAIPIPKSNKKDITIDLANYDERVLSDEKYVHYKMGFSGKREFSYKYLSKNFGETKSVLEGAMRNLRNHKTLNSGRQLKVIEQLNEIDFAFPEVEKVNRFIPLNEEVQWLIGWYIAEGDTNGKMIEINANWEELERIKKLQTIAEEYFGKRGTIDRRDNHRLRLIISSRILSKFFSNFGKPASSKHIPDEWMGLGKHLKWIVLGILEGDGTFREDCGCLITTSKKLAWQVWQILLADRIPARVVKEKNNRGFPGCGFAFLVSFGGKEYYRFCNETVSKFGNNPSKVKSRTADFAIILDHFILLPIRKIRKRYRTTKVYDISVGDIHSFVGNGYLLHNTVAEAMWKQKPVIGGNVGGIKLQIKDGQNGFLVSSPDQAARRIIELVGDPQLAKKIGKRARTTVQKKFLMPRLMRDYLRLFQKVIN